ncbi:MAG: tRNA 4-thiouridine(8) synthase ThiI [Candidatus Omnitrophica bacterium]|nr:tRNA 4-thiouridine(8) synthase ThiI [Candidatus Omnitrophota bacterium]
MTKAISLLSGGLDSILATKLILEQGIEVEGIYFSTLFFVPVKDMEFLSHKLKIKIKIFEVNEELLNIVKNPKYGYGANLNPCIDCRIFMLKKAKEYMKEIDALFLITGEVLGERPMSQRRDIFKLLEKETALEGLILRPLSAKLLPPTLPEKNGLVDRERLLGISGRSRKIQLQLAEQLKIDYYSQPAGGCLLTDPGFSKRLKDLMQHNPGFSLKDLQFLKLGRHFRLSKNTKLIIARNEKENQKILSLAEEKDLLFYPQDKKGPVALARGELNLDLINLSGAILARYCKSLDTQPIRIAYKRMDEDQENLIESQTSKEEFERYRI